MDIQTIASSAIHDTSTHFPSELPPVTSFSQQEQDCSLTNEAPVEDFTRNEQSMACIERFCSILDTCTDKRSQNTFKLVLQVLHDPHFDFDLFRTTIKSFKNCLQYNEKVFSRRVSTQGFLKEEVQYDDGEEVHSSILYRKNILDVLSKQVKMARKDDFLFECSDSTLEPNCMDSVDSTEDLTFHHPMNTPHFKKLSKDLRRRVIASRHDKLYWSNNEVTQSFPGFIQIFTDKTVTTLKSNGMAAHAVHAVFINASKSYRRYLIQNGHTIIGFLPTYIFDVSPSKQMDTGSLKVMSTIINETDQEELHSADLLSAGLQKSTEDEPSSNIVELVDNITLTSTAKGRKVKMGLIHSAMKKILQDVSDNSEKGFTITIAQNCFKVCFPLLISYCCDVPEGKDMGAVKHNLNTPYPCHVCLVSLDDIIDLETAPRRAFTETESIRQKVETIVCEAQNSNMSKTSMVESCKELLNSKSLAPWPSFLEDLKTSNPFFIPIDIYELFTYEPLHNLHLGISKLLKQCTYYYVTSKHKVSFQHIRKNTKMTISSKKSAIMRGCNNYLRAIQSDSGISSLRVDFSSKNASVTLNGLFLETGIRGMLEGKDYRNVDFVFPFIAAFIDRITQETKADLTSIHVLYSDLLHHLSVEVDNKGLNKPRLERLRKLVQSLKKSSSEFFSRFVDKGLYTLKFHLLDHLPEDIEKYASLSFTDASPFEQYNAVLKQFYRQTSKRIGTALDETVQRMDKASSAFSSSTCTTDDIDNVTEAAGLGTQRLVANGLTISLSELKGLDKELVHTNKTIVLDNLKSHMAHDDIPVLTGLIEETLLEERISVHDTSVQITFVNSGYIESYEVPTLSDYDEKHNLVKFRENVKAKKSRQRVFASHSFGPTKKKHHSTVFMKGSDKVSEFWFAKVISLFHLSVPMINFTKQMALVKYFTATKPKDSIDRALGCVCLRWETEDGEDHTLTSLPKTPTITAGERFGLVSFQSLCGVVHVVRANYAIQPFFKEIPWPYHRFYVNRFFYKVNNPRTSRPSRWDSVASI